jgi:glycosyltransferase involved in cell wall biosynthesis
MIKLTAVVITYNEERNIARCLSSLKSVADELIVIDSESTDATVAISKDLGAKVLNQPFLGYAGQRIFSDNAASNDWVLMMDADEWLSDELAVSIADFKKSPKANACRFPRLNRYCGKWIRHGAWYPDKKIRLYDRTKGSWKGGNVHEYWEAHNSSERIYELRGNLLHDSFQSLSSHLKKINRYTDIAAKDAVADGKTASVFKIWFSPKWTFLSHYFFRFGFLDGFEGYTIARMSAFMTFMKYNKIRQYSREKT